MKALRYSRVPSLCALLAAVMVSTAAALESDQLSRADLAWSGSKVTLQSNSLHKSSKVRAGARTPRPFCR